MKFEAFPGIKQLIHWVINNESVIVQGIANLVGAILSPASPAVALKNYS